MSIKTIILTNFIAPYRVPFFKRLRNLVNDLKILISTEMERNRKWNISFDDLDVIVQKNITISRFWVHPHGFTDQLYLHIPWDTLYLLIRFHPEVIVSVEFGARTFLSMVYKFINPKCNLIIWASISEITEIGRGILRNRLRKILIKKSDAVIVNGESGFRYIKSFNYPASQIFRVPYPTDTSLFRNKTIQKTEREMKRLLYMGQITERKGLHLFLPTLIKWLNKNDHTNVEFWICGSGELKNSFMNITIPKNLTIRFFNEVPYSDIPQMYDQCGALVFPTLADEWGMVVNEAMASGLVILGSVYSQAVEELVKDGITGWYFHPENPNEIMKALDQFYSMPILQLKMMQKLAQESAFRISIEYAADCMYKAISYVKEKK